MPRAQSRLRLTGIGVQNSVVARCAGVESTISSPSNVWLGLGDASKEDPHDSRWRTIFYVILRANGSVTKCVQGNVEEGLIYVPPPTTAAPPSSTTPPSTVSGEGGPDSEPVVAPIPVEGGPPLQDLGGGQVFENGVAVEAVVERVTGNQWRMFGTGFNLIADVSNVPVSPSGALTIARFSTVAVAGAGFKSQAFIDVWILPNDGLTPQLLAAQSFAPVYLVRVQVGEDGQFEGDLPVPANFEIGPHTLQANGRSFDDVLRSLNLGVQVLAVAFELPVTGSSSNMMVPAMLLLAVGTVMIVAVRRRRVS